MITILTPDHVTFYGRDWKLKLRAQTKGVKAAVEVADTDGDMAYFVLRALKGALKSLSVLQKGERITFEYKDVKRTFSAAPPVLCSAELTIARVQIKDDATGAWRLKHEPNAFEIVDGVYTVDDLFKAWFTPAHDVRVSACGKWAASTAFRHAHGVRTAWLGELFAPVQRVGSAY